MTSDNQKNTKQKRAYASNVLLYAGFVIGTIVVVNLLSIRVFGRLDLTENNVYTLSQSSKDLVKNLPDYMTVKAFMSADLPPELKSVSRYVRDLVDEYKSAATKFRWEAIDPGADKKLEEEANRCKVQKLQIQVLRNQKFEVGQYYLGLCIEYGTEVESIPQVARAEGLEYQLSSLIKKMTTKKKKVAFTTGHGEADVNQGFQAIKGDLEQEFEVTTVNPSQAEIGKDIDALIVGGPKQAIDEKGQREIDKFIMSGRGAILMADGMAMQAPGGGMQQQMQQMKLKMAQANETGLGKLLEAYGFKVNQDFVFDPQAATGPVDMGGRQPMLATLPFFVAAEVPETKDLIVAAGLRLVVFPFPSSVDLVGPLKSGKPTAKDAKLWKLATSSKDSWRHKDFFVLSPGTQIEPGKDRSASALGYAYLGPLKSAFAPANAPAVSDPNAPVAESKRPVRLVVLGDSDFANDEYMQLARYLSFYSAGAQLLFNAISWTVEDEALAPLRLKNVIPRPIQLKSEATAALLQWTNILGLPLAFCVFGLVRWRVRQSRRLAQRL
jgi:gliding-associated putative ABC transporter substrate-binding component GldG